MEDNNTNNNNEQQHNQGKQGNENNNTNDEKKFTQEELEKIISKRLEREKKKMQEEKDEAERLAKMSEAERLQEEFKKEKETFEKERKQYRQEQLKFETVKQLNAKSLPIEFADFLVADDADITLNNLKSFEELWQKAIEKEVNEKLKGSTPKSQTGTNTNTHHSSKGLIDIIKAEQVKR